VKNKQTDRATEDIPMTIYGNPIQSNPGGIWYQLFRGGESGWLVGWLLIIDIGRYRGRRCDTQMDGKGDNRAKEGKKGKCSK
jgi:hypothetical protein